MQKIIILLIVSILFLGCAKEEEKADDSTDPTTCTGTSSGNGPTIGSVTLQEGSYLSNCFNKTTLDLNFKNSTEVQFTLNQYSDDSCSGTPTVTKVCLSPLTVDSSVSSTKQTLLNNTLGDNVTGLYIYGPYTHETSSSIHTYVYPESATIFWMQGYSSDKSGADSNSAYFLKLTKQ